MNKSPRQKKRSRPKAEVPRQAGSRRDSTNASTLRRYGLVAILLVCGVLLRFAYPSHAAVEHFDEGVYASNVWFGPSSTGNYPARHLYSPPLMPLLIETSIITEQVVAPPAGGPSTLAVMLPNLVIGCLMLLAVWWVTRVWLGEEAAIGALALAAFSETHAFYTRTALTEVGLLLSLLLGLYCLERVGAFTRWRLKWILAAGILIALGWWTKYNGWMPLMIGATGLGWQFILVPSSRNLGLARVVRGLAVAAIAFGLWAPYLLSLKEVGGYRAVMTNHRSYVVGLTGWWESLSTQWQNLLWFDGWLSCLAPATALFTLIVWRCVGSNRAAGQSASRSTWVPLAACAASLVAIGCWLGSAVALACLGLVGLIAIFLFPREFEALGNSDTTVPQPNAERARVPDAPVSRSRKMSSAAAHVPNHDPDLARWILAAWFLLMFILTPLYSPYPRLALPWLCSTWIIGGAGISAIARRMFRADATKSESRRRWFVPVIVAFVAIGAIVGKSSYMTSRGVTAWQDRSELEQVAEQIGHRLRNENAVVFVYGEPALFFHLRAAGVAALPGINLQSPMQLPAGSTAYLVAGLHAQNNAEFATQLAASMLQVEELDSLPYHPSDLVLLNNDRPWELAAQSRPVVRHVLLYRIR
jgi:4-amino-4-deoxy-L-arabinose transferase-like glycosyltransferase